MADSLSPRSAASRATEDARPEFGARQTDGRAGGGPRSGRGRRTRARLQDAAATVFAREGFLDTKITDITAEAEVSSGSFYYYFETKEAIFKAVIELTIEEVFRAAAVPSGTGDSPWARIEAATSHFVSAYRQHWGLLAILEQVATFNADFREMRRGIRQAFRDRAARGIVRMQREGVIDTSLDPECTAEALTSMVSNFCYVWLVIGEEYDEATAVHTLTTLWGRAIGLREPQP